MGGKGGGGDSGGGGQYATGNIPQVAWNQDGWSTEYAKATADQAAATPGAEAAYKQMFDANRKDYVNPTTGAWDEAQWRANKGGSGHLWAAELFDRYYPEAPAPAPAPAAAPAEAAPAAAAPAEAAPAAATPAEETPAPTDASLGEQLGGAVANPPSYWVGSGTAEYDASKKKSSMTTTQT